MANWFRLGDLELLVVSDGIIRQDAGATFGLVPKVMWEQYTPDLDDKNRISVGLNSLLIRSEGKTILVDTGVGTKPVRAPGAMTIEQSGRLLENLRTEGVCVVELESGGRYGLCVGELSQVPVMLERLAWISAFDVLPLVSLSTKRRMMDWAVEKRALLISVHAPFPGLGRLVAEEGGRRKWMQEKEDL